MVNKFSPENLAVYEIMRESYCTARQATDDGAIWRVENAICLPDKYDSSTNTQS